MISKHLQEVMCNLGFRFRKIGDKYKNRYEVVYKAPFNWAVLEKKFDIDMPIKKEEYNESPFSNTVCHYFEEDNRNQFIDAVISDVEKYILILNQVVQKLKSEKDNGNNDSRNKKI